MNARDNGENNPFENTLYCLEWISSALDAARRHNEQKADRRKDEDAADRTPRSAADSED
jgi:hypothetical protein